MENSLSDVSGEACGCIRWTIGASEAPRFFVLDAPRGSGGAGHGDPTPSHEPLWCEAHGGVHRPGRSKSSWRVTTLPWDQRKLVGLAISSPLAAVMVLASFVHPCGIVQPSFEEQVQRNLVRGGYINSTDLVQPIGFPRDQSWTRRPTQSCDSYGDRHTSASLDK